MRVAEHLDLDMPCVDEQLLQVERVVAEGRVGLPRRLGDQLGELTLVARRTDPAASAARRRLHHHGVADLGGDLECLLERGLPLGARHGRDARARRHAPRLRLVAHRLDRLYARADEDEFLVAAGGGERRILRQEPVARVDRVGAGLAGCLKNGGDAQVALARVRRTDADRLVSAPHVQRVLVRRRVDGDALQAELPAGPDRPERYLAAVRDQDPVHEPRSTRAR